MYWLQFTLTGVNSMMESMQHRKTITIDEDVVTRCGAPKAAPQASARYQTRTAVASIAFRSLPPGGSIEYTRRPAGRWYPPRLASMLAESCERAANRIRTRRTQCAGRRLRESVSSPDRR